MDDHFNKKQIDKAKQLAASPQGKLLLASLMAANPELMGSVSAALSSKNYQLLASSLAPLLESDSVKQLIQQLGDE